MAGNVIYCVRRNELRRIISITNKIVVYECSIGANYSKYHITKDSLFELREIIEHFGKKDKDVSVIIGYIQDATDYFNLNFMKHLYEMNYDMLIKIGNWIVKAYTYNLTLSNYASLFEISGYGTKGYFRDCTSNDKQKIARGKLLKYFDPISTDDDLVRQHKERKRNVIDKMISTILYQSRELLDMKTSRDEKYNIHKNMFLSKVGGGDIIQLNEKFAKWNNTVFTSLKIELLLYKRSEIEKMRIPIIVETDVTGTKENDKMIYKITSTINHEFMNVINVGSTTITMSYEDLLLNNTLREYKLEASKTTNTSYTFKVNEKSEIKVTRVRDLNMKKEGTDDDAIVIGIVKNGIKANDDLVDLMHSIFTEDIMTWLDLIYTKFKIKYKEIWSLWLECIFGLVDGKIVQRMCYSDLIGYCYVTDDIVNNDGTLKLKAKRLRSLWALVTYVIVPNLCQNGFTECSEAGLIIDNQLYDATELFLNKETYVGRDPSITDLKSSMQSLYNLCCESLWV